MSLKSISAMKWEKERVANVRSGCGESWVGGVVEEEEESWSWSQWSQPPSQNYPLVTQAPPLTSWQLLPAWLQRFSACPITSIFTSASMHGFPPLGLPMQLHLGSLVHVHLSLLLSFNLCTSGTLCCILTGSPFFFFFKERLWRKISHYTYSNCLRNCSSWVMMTYRQMGCMTYTKSE